MFNDWAITMRGSIDRSVDLDQCCTHVYVLVCVCVMHIYRIVIQHTWPSSMWTDKADRLP